MSWLHCPNCYTILNGNTSELMRRNAKKPCQYCRIEFNFESYITTAEAVAMIGRYIMEARIRDSNKKD